MRYVRETQISSMSDKVDGGAIFWERELRKRKEKTIGGTITMGLAFVQLNLR